MRSPIATVIFSASIAAAAATSAHGAGSLGTVMGPVAFMWPADRPWSAEHDNTAPCGSSSGVGNRTAFPLTGGTVSLTIANDAYDVDFSISYSDNPTAQSEFTQQVVEKIAKVQAGHMCYKLSSLPSTVRSGDAATIQLEYRSKYAAENGGNDQSFYACADVRFVETAAFTLNPPCLNVTSEEFVPPPAPTASADASNNNNNSGAGAGVLSGGAIAGITVGTVVGSLAVVGAIAFFMLRKRRAAAHPSVEAGVARKANPETASVSSSLRR